MEIDMALDFNGKSDAVRITQFLADPTVEWIGKNDSGQFITMSKAEAKKYKEGWFNEMARRLGYPRAEIKITHRDDFDLTKIRAALK
jgi:protein involved in sex pheromone biosynthesis